MITSQVKIEHTRLLFSFYGKSSLLNLGFSLVIFLILHGQVNETWLYLWLALALTSCMLQGTLTKLYLNANKNGIDDYLRWYRYAIAVSVFLGLVLSIAPVFAANLSNSDYFMVVFLLLTKLTITSASGFKNIYFSSAIPILIVIAWTGFYAVDNSWYFPLLAPTGLATFYYIGQVFENTLLESIRIRFEKVELLRAKRDLRSGRPKDARRKNVLFIGRAE